MEHGVIVMTDLGPESEAAPPEPYFPASIPDPGAYQPLPQPTSRRPRGPLFRFVVSVLVVALAAGGYLLVRNVLAGRNDNKPISSSSQTTSGGITVVGRGVTMTFPSGWVNVPTTPEAFANFERTYINRLPHIKAALKSQITNLQVLRRLAMLVYDVKPDGTEAANLNAVVVPGSPPLSQLMAQLKAANVPSQFGATDAKYSETTYGQFPAVLITYTFPIQGITAHGAQAYVEGPSETAIVTVTSPSTTTSIAKLRQAVDTIKFT